MIVLEGIQNLGTQTLRTFASDGSTIEITLSYRPAIQMWFADIVNDDFSVYGMRVCNSPNLLQQYSKLIPFGINVNIPDGSEPFLVNDFSTGRVELGILTSDEVDQINESYSEAKG